MVAFLIPPVFYSRGTPEWKLVMRPIMNTVALLEISHSPPHKKALAINDSLPPYSSFLSLPSITPKTKPDNHQLGGDVSRADTVNLLAHIAISHSFAYQEKSK